MKLAIQAANKMQARSQAQQSERRRLAGETKWTKLEMQAAQMREETDMARANQDAAARKATAWAVLYKPAKKNEDPLDWDTQVECGNVHIPAQREFEARWASGQL